MLQVMILLLWMKILSLLSHLSIEDLDKSFDRAMGMIPPLPMSSLYQGFH